MTVQQSPLRELPGDPGLPLIGYSYQFASGRLTASHRWWETTDGAASS